MKKLVKQFFDHDAQDDQPDGGQAPLDRRLLAYYI